MEQSAVVQELLRPLEPASVRQARFAEPTEAAVVLGSTQDALASTISVAAARGLVCERRRSGGGGVVVAPGAQVWLDLFLPSGDVLQQHDVARAAAFVGQLWCAALARAGESRSLSIHDGAASKDDWSRRVCFAGAGAGEVFVERRKLVGVSQRRTRQGTWFFTMAMTTFDPALHAALFARSPSEEPEARARLARAVAVLGPAASAVRAALAAELGASV